jgi:hypothetical protein
MFSASSGPAARNRNDIGGALVGPEAARRRRRASSLAACAGLWPRRCDLVRVALMEARPAGLHTVQLVAATRLKKTQVQRGIRHLRDVGAAENLTPIIWRRKDGYMFSDDPADWIEYEKKQLAQVLGRLIR